MFSLFNKRFKDTLLVDSEDLNEDSIQTSISFLKEIYLSPFYKDVVAHADYVDVTTSLFKKITDPYAYIKLKIKNEPELRDNFLKLHHALTTLMDAERYFNSLPYFSNSYFKNKYSKSVHKTIKPFRPYINFVKTVVEFHEAHVNLQNKIKYQKLNSLYTPEYLEKYPRTWKINT